MRRQPDPTGVGVPAPPRPAFKITVREIASAAGVSVATVSRVLNQPALVQQGKRDAVQRAVLDLGYIPNRHARSLISRRSGAVGLLVPTLANPLFAPTIAAIEAKLDEAGQALLIHCYNRDPARQLKQVRTLLERGVDGLILTGTTSSKPLQTLLARTGVPHVVQDAVLAAPPGEYAPRVAFDNAAAMALAVQHLHDAGHRAIAVMTGPVHNTEAVADRFEGAVRRIRALDLMLPDAWCVVTGDYDSASVRDGAHRLLGAPVQPTAVACTGDILALGLVAACARRGIRVPHDLSVTGCGDTDLGQYVEPALTTVHLPWEAMGRQAVASLLAVIAGQEADGMVVLPHHLVSRSSVQRFTGIVPQ